MQKCRFGDRNIYAFNVLGKNDTVLNEIEKEWRKASELNLLKCDECGHPVILKINDPFKRRPHFAHKVINGTVRECQYSRESEEHIEGKRLIFEYMESRYPESYIEIRRRFPNHIMADVYVRFSDGRELAIEFQRLDIKVRDWERKHEKYKELGIKDLWIFRGNKDHLEKLYREYELNPFKRIMLNEMENLIICLNVEYFTATIISKITCADEDTGEIVYDKLFTRTYPVDDISILPDGSIESSFFKEFDEEKERFISQYNEGKRYKTEKLDKKLKQLNSSAKHEKTSKLRETTFKSLQHREIYIKVYEKELSRVLEGNDEEALDNIIRSCRNNITVCSIVKDILTEHIRGGDKGAQDLLAEIEKRVGK